MGWPAALAGFRSNTEGEDDYPELCPQRASPCRRPAVCERGFRSRHRDGKANLRAHGGRQAPNRAHAIESAGKPPKETPDALLPDRSEQKAADYLNGLQAQEAQARPRLQPFLPLGRTSPPFEVPNSGQMKQHTEMKMKMLQGFAFFVICFF